MLYEQRRVGSQYLTFINVLSVMKTESRGDSALALYLSIIFSQALVTERI